MLFLLAYNNRKFTLFMKNFVRFTAFFLLIVTTIIFILKIRMNIPISHLQLFILFGVGALSLTWANLRKK